MKWWWNGVEDSISTTLSKNPKGSAVELFVGTITCVLIKTTFHFSCGQWTKLSYRGNSIGVFFFAIVVTFAIWINGLKSTNFSLRNTGSAGYGGFVAPYAIQLSRTYRNVPCQLHINLSTKRIWRLCANTFLEHCCTLLLEWSRQRWYMIYKDHPDGQLTSW